MAANTLDSNGMTYVTDVDGSSTNLTGNDFVYNFKEFIPFLPIILSLATTF